MRRLDNTMVFPIDQYNDVKNKVEGAANTVKDLIVGPFEVMKKGLELMGQVFKIIELIIKLITKPHKFIPFLFILVFGLIFVAIALLWHIIWSLPGLNTVAFWLYFIVTVLLVEILVAVFFLILFVIVVLVDVALWLLDLLTLGAVRALTRCEDAPDVWYKRANWHHNNFVSSLLVCQYPCATRFKPKSGFLCRRLDRQEPSYCPQSQIYRLYKGEALLGPSIMSEYKPDFDFWRQKPEGRKELVKTFFHKRQQFLQNCSNKMQRFDPLIKNICANWDTVALPKGGPADRELLRGLCCQAFCQRSPPADFCANLRCQTDAGAMDPAELGVGAISHAGDVIRTIVNLIVLIFITTLVIVMFLRKKVTA